MPPNIDPKTIAPVLGLCAYACDRGLDRGLAELVKMRVSQLNDCVVCLALNIREARRHLSEERLRWLNDWRAAPDHVYQPSEKAALAWAEALILTETEGALDEAYEQARFHFTEEEVVNLTHAVIEIRAWNRLMTDARAPIVSNLQRDPFCAIKPDFVG
jgi:AhpD family alkylhydroperoxidase